MPEGFNVQAASPALKVRHSNFKQSYTIYIKLGITKASLHDLGYLSLNVTQLFFYVTEVLSLISSS